jgi:hypothetical protein
VRLESENKVYKTHIIISEATLQELGGAAQVNPLGRNRGATQPLIIESNP